MYILNPLLTGEGFFLFPFLIRKVTSYNISTLTAYQTFR